MKRTTLLKIMGLDHQEEEEEKKHKDREEEMKEKKNKEEVNLHFWNISLVGHSHRKRGRFEDTLSKEEDAC
jgi:hypothetical protein